MYTLPTTKEIAANPTANSANTANSSHAKYVCSETSTARNNHIHFRLLSLVFIFSLFPIPTRSNLPAELRLSLGDSTAYLDALPTPEGPTEPPRPLPFHTILLLHTIVLTTP